MFGLAGVTGDAVEVMLSSSDIDTYLRIREFSGKTLWNDDCDLGDSNSALMYYFSRDGSIEIDVASFQTHEDGSFELRVEHADIGGTIVEVAGGREIRSGTKITATMSDAVETDLTVAGPRGIQQRFTVYAEENHRIRLSLGSDFFDAFLYLTTPSGEEFKNDDGVMGTDSQIMSELPVTGTYTAEVRGYLPEATGPYNVTVMEQAGGGGVAGCGF
jgi:hypothetical protein